MATILPYKDPNSTEPYFIVWCDPDGLNTGAMNDSGELQGATIMSANWSLPAGISGTSYSTGVVQIHGVTYPINTVCAAWLTGGTDGVDYLLTCRVTLSDGRILDKSIVIPVRAE